MNKADFSTVKMQSCCWKEGNVPEIWVGLLNNQKAITDRQETNDLLDYIPVRPNSLQCHGGKSLLFQCWGEIKDEILGRRTSNKLVGIQ